MESLTAAADTPGSALQALLQFAEERQLFHVAAVALAAQHKTRGDRVIALEAHRDALQVVQAAQQ